MLKIKQHRRVGSWAVSSMGMKLRGGSLRRAGPVCLSYTIPHVSSPQPASLRVIAAQGWLRLQTLILPLSCPKAAPGRKPGLGLVDAGSRHVIEGVIKLMFPWEGGHPRGAEEINLMQSFIPRILHRALFPCSIDAR